MWLFSIILNLKLYLSLTFFSAFMLSVTFYMANNHEIEEKPPDETSASKHLTSCVLGLLFELPSAVWTFSFTCSSC